MNKINQKKLSIADLLNEGRKRLKENGNLFSNQEAELLLSYLLNWERYELYVNHVKEVVFEMANKYYQWIQLRNNGTPIQYITGFQQFYGMEFRVSEGVFIPRPETEILVEKIIKLIESSSKKELLLLDIGTGTGIIPITICHYFQKSNINVRFYAIDISNVAIKLARENARKHRCQERIQFFQGNLFQPLSVLKNPVSFDGIISNPPYIDFGELQKLPDEIRLHEPRQALCGGKDGLQIYRKIIKNTPMYLKKGNGFLAFEIGYNQCNAVMGLIQGNCAYRKDIITFKDYLQKDRGIIAFIR